MKIAVIGGVTSTAVLIRKLGEYGFTDVAVFGYRPANPSRVSGWVDLKPVAREFGFFHADFVKVGECLDALRLHAPDILFAVGLSQIIPEPMLAIAGKAAIGFHPTALPKGRGRAPIAWIVMDGVPGAASFFQMRAGVDDGPIYVQEAFDADSGADAAEVMAAMLRAEARALDKWLPRLADGDLECHEQDHRDATWYGKRSPDDGVIDWTADRDSILTLVRASTLPHPGAFTYCGDHRISILRATPSDRPEKGVVGRILSVNGNEFVVQAGDAPIRIESWTVENVWQPVVGARLGYYPDVEIAALRVRCGMLESRLAALEAKLMKSNL